MTSESIISFTITDASNHGYAGMCLGDVVDHLTDGHAPSNASATKESKLPNPLVCRPSTMDPTRRNPEFNAPETTTIMLSRARDNLSIPQNQSPKTN